MNTAAEVLLLIVSATLTIFLIVAMVAVVKFIQILRDIRRIAQKAEQIADKAEAVGEFFQKTAAPAAILKLIANVVSSFKDGKHANKEDR